MSWSPRQRGWEKPGCQALRLAKTLEGGAVDQGVGDPPSGLGWLLAPRLTVPAVIGMRGRCQHVGVLGVCWEMSAVRHAPLLLHLANSQLLLACHLPTSPPTLCPTQRRR